MNWKLKSNQNHMNLITKSYQGALPLNIVVLTLCFIKIRNAFSNRGTPPLKKTLLKNNNENQTKRTNGEKMNREKACRECRFLTEEGEKCLNCDNNTFTTFWRGYVVITDPENSEIAKKMGITRKGKFALRLSR
jgi:DNA-directed RNA polymerase subunit E"